MNKNTIELIPSSVAIGLQNDVLQFYNEVKFNLLFFDNPIAILSTSNFDAINAEDIHLIKKKWKFSESPFTGQSALRNYEIVATEEWDELMSYCKTWDYTFTLRDKTDKIETDATLSEELENVIEETAQTLKKKKGTFINNGREIEWTEDIISFFKEIAKLQFIRLEELLDYCYDKEVSMIWSNETDTLSCQAYLQKLIKNNEDKLFKKDVDNTKLRQILGDKLLQSVMNFKILNISAVPTDKIIEFKNKNKDLLNNFLIYYREYLAIMQSDPKKYKEITQKYTQELAQKLNEINNEILISRDTKKYKWINTISKEAYDSAKKSLPIGIWSILSNPYGIATALGMKLINIGYKAIGVELNEEEKFKKFLLNSSAGYLWKARETFK